MTWMTTVSGRALNLLGPNAAEIRFRDDVAPALGRIARFTGHVGSGPYSVAQHCVVGSDALFAETANPNLAAAFLLHDAHEAYCGDIGSPMGQALDFYIDVGMRIITSRPHAAQDRFGTSLWRSAIERIKGDLDFAIFKAAGLVLPSEKVREAVKAMDLRMLKAERDQLLVRSPQRWAAEVEAAAPVRMAGKLTVWPWPKAAEEWLRRLAQFCPAAAL